MTTKEKIGAVLLILICLLWIFIINDMRESSRRFGYYGAEFELTEEPDYPFTSDRFFTNYVSRRMSQLPHQIKAIMLLTLLSSFLITAKVLIPKSWYKKEGRPEGEYPLIERFKLVKDSFPKTWVRKWVLLWMFIITAKTKKENEKTVGLHSELFGVTVLLCVNPLYQKKGIALELLSKSKACWTMTLVRKKTATRFWKNRGYKIVKRVNVPFYDSYYILKKNDSKKFIKEAKRL